MFIKTKIKALSLITAFTLFVGVGITVAYGSSKTEKEVVSAQQTYIFTGIAGEENQQDKYTLSDGTPSNCDGNGVRCEVSANPDPSNPELPLLDGTEQVLNHRN